MNRSNTIGLIVVIIVILGIFVYVDFFAPALVTPLPPNSASTSTSPEVTPSQETDSTSTVPIAIVGTTTLAVHEERKVADTIFSASDIVEDSRCPSGVQCIQAGRVVATVRFSSPSRDWSVQMKPGDSVYAPSFTLTLEDVAPYPVAGQKTKEEDYRLTFVIGPSDLPVTPKPPQGKCYVGGCSGQICSDDPNAISNCIYNSSYACYQTATCERQTDGQCGWTQTQALQSCLMKSNQNS